MTCLKNKMWAQFLNPSIFSRSITCLLFFILISQLAFAEVTTNDISDLDKKVDVSPVMVDGEVLFTVRGASSLPSEQRAKIISDRIVNVAKDSRLKPEELKIVPNKMYDSINAGNVKLVSIFDADSKLEDLDRSTLAEVHLNSIRVAIQHYRTQRTLKYRIEIGFKIFIATLIFILIIFSLKWLSRKFIFQSGVIAKKHLAALETSTFSLFRADQTLELIKLTIRVISWIIILIAFNAYLSYVLVLMPWARPFAVKLISLIMVPLHSLSDSFISSLPGLIFIAILIIVLRYILRLIKILFIDVGNGKVSWHGFESEWAVPSYRLIRIFIIVAGLVIAYPYIPGSKSEAFKGVSILFGLLVSIGSSSLISNIIAGYSLIYRRAFKIGDWIQIGEHFGEVIRISSMVSNLRTFKNEIVVVPNSDLINTSLVNYSTMKKEGKLILHTTVGIGYETPWRQVEAMLKSAANKTEGLLKNPEPFVFQKSLGDFCAIYEINAYTDAPELMPNIYSFLHQNIQDIFNEYGVQIMTPAYTADPEKPKVVAKDDWYTSPANIKAKKEDM